jgi:anti-sigma-K factor RskA
MHEPMRYRDPGLREILCGEYALGALHGAARSRFETLMRHDPDLRRRVRDWQQRLAPLSEQTAPVEPPARLLETLRQRIEPEGPALRGRWWERVGFWRPMGVASLALAVLLVAYLVYFRPVPGGEPGSELQYVGVLTDQRQQPAAAVLAYGPPWRLEVQSRDPLPISAETEIRAWVVQRTGDRTRFLARISATGREIIVDSASWNLLSDARALVISQDQSDSSTERPTGRVLYSGPCVSLQRWQAKEDSTAK